MEVALCSIESPQLAVVFGKRPCFTASATGATARIRVQPSLPTHREGYMARPSEGLPIWELFSD